MRKYGVGRGCGVWFGRVGVVQHGAVAVRNHASATHRNQLGQHADRKLQLLLQPLSGTDVIIQSMTRTLFPIFHPQWRFSEMDDHSPWVFFFTFNMSDYLFFNF